ncbi:MAG TPA: phenylacetate--CoA ligase [Firmicutes bacterium]|nr:phenylacetate--CoA ligase [Bacillota bacterium]
MAYLEEQLETMPQEQLVELQLEKFKKQVRHLCQNEFYRRRCMEAGLSPDDLKDREDIKKVPFTFKKDLRDNYPKGLISGNWDDVVRIHMTSGTTGVPTILAYSKNDIETWTRCMARNFVAGGLRRDDVVQQAHGYGLFTGGFGFHYGLERAGAKVIPTGSGGTERQLRLMQEWGTTVFTGTPSYAAYIAEIAMEKGIDPIKDLKLRLGFHGGEPCSDGLRKRINERLGYRAHGGGMRVCYGLTEMGGPMSMDCEYECGQHIWADHYLVEAIDPVTLNYVKPEEAGELVLSNLSFEAMPILRYRTGDRVTVSFATCPCGRTHPRITSFLGRVDDMILVSGTNVFPSQVEYVLLKHPELSENWQLVVSDKRGLHSIKVEIEPVPGSRVDEDFVSRLEKELHDYLEIKCSVEIKAVGSLPRFEGKAVRVLDQRQ